MIKNGSPFTEYLQNALVAVKQDTDDAGAPNDDYCSDGFDAIRSYIHLFPLWSASLHDNVQRLACDAIVNVKQIAQRSLPVP